MIRTTQNWSDSEKQYLADHYSTLGKQIIAKRLCRTEDAVNQMAARIGVRKPGRTNKIGKSYKKCLPKEKWETAERFLVMLAKMKKLSKTRNKPAKLDLSAMREAMF